MKQSDKNLINRQLSTRISHFVNNYCLEEGTSYYEAYTRLLELYKRDEKAFENCINSKECPKIAS